MSRVRKVASVPRPVIALLAVGLAAQLTWHALRPDPEARAVDLPAPPGVASLRLISLGDPVVLSRLLMLWLQAFDNQPGISIPFRELDYTRLIAWLERILALDPGAQYPLLAAARLYAEAPAEAKQRQMLEFIHREFRRDPNRRWPWLAHAAIIAKHRLGDLPLALRYARDITALATGPEVPFWARDMSVMILEDMGELESARVLIGGLLASGAITDPHEQWFLAQKLEQLKEKSDEKSTVR